LAVVEGVFAEEERSIPAGVEDMQMAKLGDDMLGATRKKRRVKRKA